MSKHLTVGSLFAGIGGFDLAAERAGMEVKWQSQWEPPRWGWNAIAKKIKNRKVKAGLRENPKFGRWIDDPQKASLVLDHHFPDIPNYGDIHEIRNPPAVDILCGGFPCQDYSVAGARHGLAGDRGALWWEFHRLIAGLRPTWVVGENVPGLLSSRGGRDFETIIGSLTELGYGVAWAVLDAQYFGVAQRRRRVFIVGHSGGIPRPEVLALGQGVFGDSPPSRETGKAVAALTRSGLGGGGADDNLAQAGHLIPTSSVRGGGFPGILRRLTPLECERLQGFPDGWTDIPGNSDTQRYKQLGNAVAVPVAEWIFRRIVAAESGRIL